MMSRRKTDKYRRRSDLAEFRVFSDSFILTPRKSVHTENAGTHKLPNIHNQTFPVLKVSKSSAPMWGAKDNNNLKAFPNVRYQPRSRFMSNREDTFDMDFSMPKEIREVLEEEGLEKKVINRAIGRSELKHKMMRKMTKGEPPPRISEEVQQRLNVVLPPIISTTTKRNLKYPGTDTSSWLDLSRQSPVEFPRISLWENPVKGDTVYRKSERILDEKIHQIADRFSEEKSLRVSDATEIITNNHNSGENVSTTHETIKVEVRRTTQVPDKVKHTNTPVDVDKTVLPDVKHVNNKTSCNDNSAPRIVLISSKVPKCHLLTQVFQKEVIIILYDFDTCTFSDLIDAIAKKLSAYKRNCKAQSIMVLCQGGPGYICLLKNFAITPKKLNKPSYKNAVGFWRALSGMVCQHNTEASIYLFGFNLTDNIQGRALLTILQNLMYPNLVRVAVVNDNINSEESRTVIEQYFIYRRYQVWKTYQRSSFNDVDIPREDPRQVKRHFRVPVMRVAR